METKHMTVYEQAMAYHANGYNVLPMGPDKRPLIPSWKKWQTETQTDEQVSSWFKESKSNVAIITGKISGITVIDIDNKAGQEQADAMLKKFPVTFTVRTPSGGYHLYYQYAEGFTVSANAYPDLPNVDIRSDSGYVGAAPSVNSNGKAYEVINNIPLSPFPTHLFPKQKPRKSLTEKLTASKGSRNDNLTSFAGQLLQAEQDEYKWLTDVFPAIQRANKTYTPVLPDHEVVTIFNSIAKKEKQRREGFILSPIQMDNGEIIKDFKIQLRKNGNAVVKDMANAYIVLENHPYYKGTIKYNEFRHQVEYNGNPLEDSDVIKIQHFMQTEIGLHGIQQNTIFSAIIHYAQKNKYDEAKDWIRSLVWDHAPRLNTWLTSSCGVPSDAYHCGIGSQWFNGMVSRIMKPGSIFDYMLLITGDQGLGKTSLFRIIGGPWYKCYSGSVENKDFYLALRGALVVDLDEGAAMYKSEVVKLKTVISETHDEFREPYGKIMKKYPRRFVFSMSTNDAEPFRDVTGNRRYWPIDIKSMVNFKWLEDNRDQLFAEAYYCYINGIKISEVPEEEAKLIQEAHLPDDPWDELVCDEVRKSYEYCAGDPNFSTTVIEIYKKIFTNSPLERLARSQEIRISHVFKKELGLEKIRKMIGGEQKNRWYITEKKMRQLRARNAVKATTELEEFTNELKQGHLDI